MTDPASNSTSHEDWLKQRPGESRSEWKERTFAIRYGMGLSKMVKLAQARRAVRFAKGQLTLHFKETLLCHSSLTHTPIYYVGYDKPTREDMSWELEVTPVILSIRGPLFDWVNAEPVTTPTHYSMVWIYLNDDQAKADYPIFNELASEYNWKPLRPAHVGDTYA